MSQYSVGARATGAGTTTLPTMSLYGVAATGFVLREVGVFNTTTTACVYELVVLSTAGTQGTGLTEGSWDDIFGGPQCTAFQAHSSTAPTIARRTGVQFPCGAAIGSGVIRTFGGSGVRVNKGTANGVGLVVVGGGTGQLCDIDLSWEE